MTRDAIVEFVRTLPERASLGQVICALLALEPEERGEAHPPAVPTVAEVQALLRAPDNERDRLILRTFYATGLRIHELASLRVADLSFAERKLFVRSGKGDIDRYALADPVTMAGLQAWCAGRGPAERVFPADRRLHEIVAEAGAATGLRSAYQERGLNLSPHSFRHAFATHCYENGMDPWTLKRLLGHAYLETTAIYLATSERRVRPLYSRCHELSRRYLWPVMPD